MVSVTEGTRVLRPTKYQSGKRLSGSEIYPSDDRCPICGYTEPRAKRLLIQHGPDIYLLFCPRCLGYSASHMPTREALDRYYGSYYQHCEQERVTFYKPIRLARRIASMVALPSSRDISILDFGGGDGSISALTAELISRQTGQAARVQVIDYVKGNPARNEAVEMEFLRDLKDARGDCDLLIASGIFEHIPNLASIMPEVIGKLRPGGFLYVRTPYMLPFMKTIGMDMTYPGHVHDLGDRFWGTFPEWFSIPLEIVKSRPAIVQSGFRQELISTLAAYCLKLPSQVECLWTRHPMFKFYGGWEAVMRRSA